MARYPSLPLIVPSAQSRTSSLRERAVVEGVKLRGTQGKIEGWHVTPHVSISVMSGDLSPFIKLLMKVSPSLKLFDLKNSQIWSLLKLFVS
jgi:hypothetical protein